MNEKIKESLDDDIKININLARNVFFIFEI